ncbi:galactosyldiacylglycerol synthase [Bhargavaea ullalensis]|uniref:UDP-N-acetylglucosamine:LPS N-acetylglucosamine transferase n=1 Tax=Bhargavaea ullalensis TaxID=1265685 RepID=A0ABV2GEE0_9BACL
MRKIIFFSHLRTQSGHHQAAEALMDLAERRMGNVSVKKLDLLTETSPLVERLISFGYMNWIRSFPETYDRVYESWFCHGPDSDETNFKWYQPFLINKMRDILEREEPDLIFCSHSLPSLILSKMKIKGQCRIPVINVYTDLFVNCVWGRQGIDAHFLPTPEAKQKLILDGLAPERLQVTGIPVHRAFRTVQRRPAIPAGRPVHVLIAGGNTGLGSIDRLREELRNMQQIRFTVLCGKNRRLFRTIRSWEMPHVTPVEFISSRSEMNELYDRADALITKPGGVTLSEGLRKKLPMFIHSALPGQERHNLDYLTQKGLAFSLKTGVPLSDQILGVMTDALRMHRWNRAVDRFRRSMDVKTETGMVEFIESLLAVHENDPAAIWRKPSLHPVGK